MAAREASTVGHGDSGGHPGLSREDRGLPGIGGLGYAQSMFRRAPGSSRVIHPVAIELPRQRRRAQGQASAASRVVPLRVAAPEPRPRESEGESGLADRRLAKLMKQVALQEVELARLRVDHSREEAAAFEVPLGRDLSASPDRAGKNRAAMDAIFMANRALREELAGGSLNH